MNTLDRKTLEYMEERANKAREIVKKIDGLVKESERIDQIGHISFQDIHGNNLFALSKRFDGSNNRRRLVDAIRPALKQLIVDEIATLEQELAEL